MHKLLAHKNSPKYFVSRILFYWPHRRKYNTMNEVDNEPYIRKSITFKKRNRMLKSKGHVLISLSRLGHAGPATQTPHASLN